jgi:hypothetical protein
VPYINAQLSISPPVTGKEFEYWCKWVARNLFGPEVFLYEIWDQHGIDICWSNHVGYSVIQCAQRTTPSPSELMGKLQADFARALEYFGERLNTFYFATTASIDTLSDKIQTKSNGSQSLFDLAIDLSAQSGVPIILWSWNYLADIISESPFLLRHILERAEGAQLIDKVFFENQVEQFKNILETELQHDFYSGKENIQWHGIARGWDAARPVQKQALEAIYASFDKALPIAAVVTGEGGSGKSVLLKRIASRLCNTYTVYWLGSNIIAFLNNEWEYDVKAHPEAKFLIVIDDWYRTVEKNGHRQAAMLLLNEMKMLKHARLIIGDRGGNRRSYNDFSYTNHAFRLSSSENQALLSQIAVQYPPLQKKLAGLRLDTLNSALFVLLFILSYDYVSDNETEDRFTKIFESDAYALRKRPEPFWAGMAEALYLYANLYVEWGITLRVESLLELACQSGQNKAPYGMHSGADWITDDEILNKYLAVIKLGSGRRVKQVVQFNHDTIAEKGWSVRYSTVKTDYRPLETALKIVEKFEQLRIPGLANIYWRLAAHQGPEGAVAAAKYLSTWAPDANQQAFIDCLQRVKTSSVALEAARRFLSKRKAHYKIGAFNECLLLLHEEQIAKEVARKYLKRDAAHANPVIFYVCARVLKGEQPIRNAALRYLNEPHIYRYSRLFTLSLSLLRKSLKGTQAALRYINSPNRFADDYALAACLGLLKEQAVDTATEFLNSPMAGIDSAAFWSSLKIAGSHNRGRAIVEEYLLIDDPFSDQEIFCLSLKVFGKETFTLNAARRFLRSSEPFRKEQAFSACISLLKEEELAKHASLLFLASVEPYVYETAFCAATRAFGNIEVVQDVIEHVLQDVDGRRCQIAYLNCMRFARNRDIAKKSAELFLATSDAFFWPQLFAVSIKACGSGAAKHISHFLDTYHQNTTWEAVFMCLKVLSAKGTEIPNVDRLLARIIAERDRRKFRDLLKLPFFESPAWCATVKKILVDWHLQNRNNLHHVLLSHLQRPDEVAETCLSIVKNWRRELYYRESKSCFLLSLANPVNLADDYIRAELIAICVQILTEHEVTPFRMQKQQAAIIRAIVEEGIFPPWKAAHPPNRQLLN